MKIIANNKRANFDYDITLKISSGLALTGSEVKSLRNNSSSIKEAYVEEKSGELWLCNCFIKREIYFNFYWVIFKIENT